MYKPNITESFEYAVNDNRNVYEVFPQITFQFYVNYFWIKEKFEAGIRNFSQVSF